MGMLVSQTKNSNTSYFLQDAQGSTVALADDTGVVTSTYSYDAFGNLDDSATLETSYLYTGQQYDATTELYSLRARYYDTEVGRFLTRDTWAYDYQNPVELNRYVYTANNPATYIDPSGHMGVVGYGETNSLSYSSGTVAQAVTTSWRKSFVSGMVQGVLGAILGKLLALTIGYYAFSEQEVALPQYIQENMQALDDGLDILFAGVFGGLLEINNEIMGRTFDDGMLNFWSSRLTYPQMQQLWQAGFITNLAAGLSSTALSNLIHLGQGHFDDEEIRAMGELSSDIGITITTSILAGQLNLVSIDKEYNVFWTFFLGSLLEGLGAFADNTILD